MKKLICFLMIAFMAFIISPMVAMAESVASAVVDSPTGLDLGVYFATLTGLVSLVLLVTQFAKKLIVTSGFWTKFLSWIVAIVTACIGYFLQLGIFAGMEWYWILIYALSSGLIANSIVDIGIVQAILSLFTSKKQ